MVLNPTYAVAGIALRADWDEIPTFHGDIYCKFPRCACSGLCKKLERLFVSCYFLEKFSKKYHENYDSSIEHQLFLYLIHSFHVFQAACVVSPITQFPALHPYDYGVPVNRTYSPKSSSSIMPHQSGG